MKKLPATWEELCAIAERDPLALPDVSAYPEKHRKHAIADFKLIIAAEVLNEGWTPDYNNDDEWKYFPYFEVEASKDKPSGFGLAYGDYDDWLTHTHVGSRLCYKSSALAKYAGETFIDIYKDHQLIE